MDLILEKEKIIKEIKEIVEDIKIVRLFPKHFKFLPSFLVDHFNSTKSGEDDIKILKKMYELERYFDEMYLNLDYPNSTIKFEDFIDLKIGIKNSINNVVKKVKEDEIFLKFFLRNFDDLENSQGFFFLKNLIIFFFFNRFFWI